MDLTGQRFGRLTVVGPSGKRGWWLCHCDCGSERPFTGSALRGQAKSCVCLLHHPLAPPPLLRVRYQDYISHLRKFPSFGSFWDYRTMIRHHTEAEGFLRSGPIPMIITNEQQWLTSVYQAAVKAGHIFPAMAACEAALESEWGKSELAVDGLNLFGLKKPSTWAGKTISIATEEFLRGKWVRVPATWPVFTDYAECMQERMNVLKVNACYAAALKAPTPEAYITAVSVHWSTDPQRGQKCLEIYNAHAKLLEFPASLQPSI